MKVICPRCGKVQEVESGNILAGWERITEAEQVERDLSVWVEVDGCVFLPMRSSVRVKGVKMRHSCGYETANFENLIEGGVKDAIGEK